MSGELLLLILGMSLVTMGSRFLGFFAVGEPGGEWARALHYLPYGLFAAIVVTNAPERLSIEALPFVAALAVTGIAARKGAPVIVSLALGWGAAWLLRLAL